MQYWLFNLFTVCITWIGGWDAMWDHMTLLDLVIVNMYPNIYDKPLVCIFGYMSNLPWCLRSLLKALHARACNPCQTNYPLWVSGKNNERDLSGGIKFSTLSRGVGRNFRRGFPPTVDPRRGGLGARSPEADGYFKILWSNFAVFCMFEHLEILPRIVQGL